MPTCFFCQADRALYLQPFVHGVCNANKLSPLGPATTTSTFGRRRITDSDVGLIMSAWEDVRFESAILLLPPLLHSQVPRPLGPLKCSIATAELDEGAHRLLRHEDEIHISIAITSASVDIVSGGPEASGIIMAQFNMSDRCKRSTQWTRVH